MEQECEPSSSHVVPSAKATLMGQTTAFFRTSGEIKLPASDEIKVLGKKDIDELGFILASDCHSLCINWARDFFHRKR